MLVNDYTVMGPMPGLHHYCRAHIAAGVQVVAQYNMKNTLWIETQNLRQHDFGDGQFGPTILCNRVKVLPEGSNTTTTII